MSEEVVSEEFVQIRERQSIMETKIVALESSIEELLVEVRRIATLLRGNGENGLVSRIDRAHERIEALQSQWRWMAGLLAALVLASVKSMLWD